MVKRRISPLAVFILFFVFSSLAGGALAEGAEISLVIRYYDMRVYYLDRDPILVQVTLTNNGPGPFRFKLADERAFSLDFDVRTTTNRAVEPASILIRRRSTSSQVYFREILIETGESFSFVEDLRDYALLDKSGAYVVQAKIYPELYRSEYVQSSPAYLSSGQDFRSGSYLPPAGLIERTSTVSGGAVLESNRLSLNLRPPQIPGPDGPPLLALDEETRVERTNMPPDEVVTYMLTARQKEQWEKFKLYLDLEAMVSRDPYRRREWTAESEEGRQRMIDRYWTELQSSVIDGDISTIPKDFEIENTQYGSENGTVTALEYFQVGRYTEKKRYTYQLRRRDNIWSIVDYSVVNLGTE